MLNNTINDAFNAQMNYEFYSAFAYLSMSAWCESQDLSGFSYWMHQQYLEELEHGQKFFAHIHDRGGVVKVAAMDAPQTEWVSPLAVFENALAHEESVTARINDLMSMALKENDHASSVFLQWFITEQVEEEKTVSTIIQNLKLVEKSADGLFMIDRELAHRVPDGE